MVVLRLRCHRRRLVLCVFAVLTGCHNSANDMLLSAVQGLNAELHSVEDTKGFSLHSQTVNRSREPIEGIEDLGGLVFHPTGQFGRDEALILSRLPNLRVVDFSNSQFDDHFFANFASSSVEHLVLDNSNFRDPMVNDLKNLRGLKAVYVYNTQCSPEGLAILQQMMPKVTIVDRVN